MPWSQGSCDVGRRAGRPRRRARTVRRVELRAAPGAPPTGPAPSRRRASARRRRAACRRGPPRGTTPASVGPPSSSSDCTPSAASARSSSSSGPLRSSSSDPSGSGPRPKASRRGCRDGADVAARQRGSSARTVPIPTATASDRRPQLVHAPAALLAGHPARAGHRHAPVERHRDLVGDERPTARDPDAPGLVLRPRLPRVDDLDLDAGRAEPLEAAPVDLRVRIADAGDDARDAGLHDGVRARRRRARDASTARA